MTNEYILAKYDIRGKQEYIYQGTRHIKEIVGGSCIIRDCFKDYLFEAAIQYRNKLKKRDDYHPAIFNWDNQNIPFSVSEFTERMQQGIYLGEVIYSGGGNVLILYKNKEVCCSINKIFSQDLMQHTYSLRVLCTYIENVNFKNFKEDREKLNRKHLINENRDGVTAPCQTLPFSKVDYETSMPLYKSQMITKKPLKYSQVSRESYLKYEKYWKVEEEEKEILGEKLLDAMVTEKGEESLLAIIYIDGNNMAANFNQCLEGENKGYMSCVTELRRFSEEIQMNYIKNRCDDIDKALAEKYKNKKRRFVVFAGDEITFICNARDAYDLTKAYFANLPSHCSSCAGIAIFHSHAPYADAYRIAEECCESGKSKMKKEAIQNANLIDVHYCQGAIGIDLKTIRKKEVGILISKPWFISVPEELKNRENVDINQYITVTMVEKMAEELNKTGRSNIKSLAEYAKRGIGDLKMELARIKAHSKQKFDFSLNGALNEEQMKNLIYDIVILYGLWFAKEEQQKGIKNEQEKSSS